jgi:16S rRNA processing protein RimM
MKLDFIEAGEIVTTHGVRGEVKLLTWLDSPEFMCEFKRVRIEGTEYKLESCRVQKTCNLLKLKGIDTVEDAQALRDKTVEIFRSDVSDDVVFAAELVGMQVYADGIFVGELVEVMDYPGNQVYVIRGEHEYMIPAVKEFILSVDMEKNEMQVRLIKGMGSHED